MNEREFEEQLVKADRRGLEAQVAQVRAIDARYDHASGDLVVALRGGLRLLVPVELLQGVAGGRAEQIERVEVVAGGSALRWPELDADFGVQDVAAGSFGTRAWMQGLEEAGALDEASLERRRLVEELLPQSAAAMDRRGGQARSSAKVAASRANGAKGGRPRKTKIAA